MTKQGTQRNIRDRVRRLGLIATLVAASAVGSASHAQSRFLPEPQETALPHERPLFNDLIAKMATGGADDLAANLKTLDEALGKLAEPTKLRGVVQMMRAGILLYQNENTQAIAAVEESIRLLPDYSGPLISAASVYAYSNRPGQGADYLLRASQKDPDTVRLVDDYEINNLMARLDAVRDEHRIQALSDRLIAIGWVGKGLGSGSGLARDAIKRRLRAGDLAGARALVAKLVVPAHSRSLLMTTAFQQVWPDIDRWAGPKLQLQWSIYLNEARERWTASKDVGAVRDYSAALLSAGHDETVIREILPLFDTADVHDDYDLIFVVAGVAGALAHEGRWKEANALFERAQKIWPLGSHANALNVTANHAGHLLVADRYKDALAKIDEAIADARKWGAEVNSDALAAMHHFRACALHGLGRDSEAGISIALAQAVETPAAVAGLHLCMDNLKAARQALIDGLKTESQRESVIAFVQKSDDRVAPSAYSRKMRARSESLRGDASVLAEVAKYGRVLPYRLNDGAPPEDARK